MVSLIPLYVFLITLLLGPFIFYWLGQLYYKKRKLRVYPLYLVDGIGDTIFLPWFNAIAFGYGINFLNSYFALAGALAISVGWLTYRLFWEKTFDWSMPKYAKFSFGGWYHMGFFFIETFIILSAISELYNNFWVWLPLIGYFILSTYTLIYQVPKYKKPFNK